MYTTAFTTGVTFNNNGAGAAGQLPSAAPTPATGAVLLTGSFATGLTLVVDLGFTVQANTFTYVTSAADVDLTGVASGIATMIANSSTCTGSSAFLLAPTFTGSEILFSAKYNGIQGNNISLGVTGAGGITLSGITTVDGFFQNGSGAQYIIPQQRIPKRDIATALGIALNAIGLTNNVTDTGFATATSSGLSNLQVWITYDGSFHQSMIRDGNYAGRTVIVVGHGSESDKPVGIGQQIGFFPASGYVDPTPVNASGTGAAETLPPPYTLVHESGNEVSTEVDLSIFDTRFEVGIVMDALVATVMRNIIYLALISELSYSKCQQVGKAEAPQVMQPQGGEPYIVYQWDRNYTTTWYDRVIAMDPLVNIVWQLQTVIDWGTVTPSDDGLEKIETVI